MTFSCDLGEFGGATANPGAAALAVAVPPAPELEQSEPAAPAFVEPTPAEEVAVAPPPDPDPERRVRAFADFIAANQVGLAPEEVVDVARTLLRESEARDFDPHLVLAVLQVESGFDNFAVSSAGAYGLMQILPETGEDLARRIGLTWRGPRTLFDPVANVTLGIAYLDELVGRFGEIATALAAYNWGPSRIRGFIRRGRQLPVNYSNRVLGYFQEGLGPVIPSTARS